MLERVPLNGLQSRPLLSICTGVLGIRSQGTIEDRRSLSLSLSLALRWQGTVVGGLTGVFSLHVAHTHKKNQSVGTLPRVEERARTGPEPGPFPDPGGSIARVPRNVFFLLPSSPRPLSLSRPRSHSSQGSKPCR